MAAPNQGGIRLILPVPPSLNHYWIKVRNRIVISADGMAFRDHVQLLCNLHDIQPLSGAIAITARVYRPANRGDLDNYLKALLDALNTRAYHDDKQIVELHAYKAVDRANPRVEIEIQEI